MLEPYVSLTWWLAGCLLVVTICEVIAARGTSKWGAWRDRVKWVHVPVWVLVLTVLTITDTVAQPGTKAFGAVLGYITALAFLCLFYVGSYWVIIKDNDARWILKALRALSFSFLATLLFGMLLGSTSMPDRGAHPVSVEYAVSANGSRSPIASERHELKRVSSSDWVTVAAVEHKPHGKNSSTELRTAYTWNEVRGRETVAKTTTIEQDDVTVVEDVVAGKAAWVEYIPVYYLAPAGIFDGSRPDPIQGNLCVRGRDTGCKVNALQAHMKYVLHVPASAKQEG
mgnify:FL=1|jgi:hypothetical protein